MNISQIDIGALLVITTLPDENQAVKIVEAPVSARLAACVHTFASGDSVYWWQDQKHLDTEILVQIKTATSRYAELETVIKRLHPNDVSEIITLPITAGMPAFLH